MTQTFIAWDLGATKCMTGVVESSPTTTGMLRCVKTASIKLSTADSLASLVKQVETALDIRMNEADAICIGAAGHFDGNNLILENAYPYPMPFAAIANDQHWPTYAVIHDYAPLVCATFTDYMTTPGNVKHLNCTPFNPLGRRVTFGIGTGLGLKDGVLLENGDFWLGKNEVGHIGITTPPCATAIEIARHHDLMQCLENMVSQEPNPALTFEKLLSGQGLVRLYQFLHPSETQTTPEEVGLKMQQGVEPELQDLFAWYTGLFVGNIQLIFMPEGGIWLSGGVALNHIDVFDRPSFRAGIVASPAYLVQRETYPLGLLCNPEHALIGCGYYASKRLLTTPRQVSVVA